MARRTFIVILLTIGCCLSSDSGFARSSLCQELCPAKPQSPFRYIIIRNEMTELTSHPGEKIVRFRAVDVLLEAKSFSEVNLRALFGLISKRFLSPDDLRVSVYTNIENVMTPEEAEYILPSCIGIDFPVPEAFYMRNSDFEKFDYRTKEPRSPLKTVKLRGD